MRLENEKKEQKRHQDRLRYQEKKNKLNKILNQSKSNIQIGDASFVSNQPSTSKTDVLFKTSHKIVSPQKSISKTKKKEKSVNFIINTRKSIRRKNKTATKKSAEEKKNYEREKKRKQRAKIYKDPILHSKFLETTKKYYQNYKRKTISNMTKKDQKAQRKKWRDAKRTQAKLKKLQNNNTLTPSSNNETKFQVEIIKQTPSKSPYKIAGIRKTRKNRESLQNKIENLEKINKELEEKNCTLKRESNRYKKKCQRLSDSSKKNEGSPSPNKKVNQIMNSSPKTIEKELRFSFALQKQIKNNYDTASPVEKTTIARSLAGKVIKKYQCMKRLTPLISLKRYRPHIHEPGFILKKQVRNKDEKAVFEKVTLEFFLDDEITTQSPNKNDFLTFKKEKRLKRYLNDTLSNLYIQFKQRTKIKICFNTFLKYKPFFVVYLKCNARNTCACVKHLNMQLKLDRLRELKIIESSNLSDLMSKLTCNSERAEKCMLALCLHCKIKMLTTFEYATDITSHYYIWDRAEEERMNKKGEKYVFKAMTKRKIIETQEKIVALTNQEIPGFLQHLHNIHNQAQYNKHIKKNLNSETVVLHSDFSENYATKCHTEIQALHYGGSRTLLTLHTNAYYILDRDKVNLYKICTISEDVRHTSPAVFAHLEPIFQKFKEAAIKVLQIFTDGPTTQYRNKTSFALICHFAKLYGFETVVWNFWESGHGKGIIDGLGGTLKSKADNKVGQGSDITDVKSFIEAVKDVKIDLLEVKSESIDEVNKIIPEHLTAATGTFQIHQIIWKSNNGDNLYLRKRSCMHNDNFSPCSMCDLTVPAYCPTEIVPKKKLARKTNTSSEKMKKTKTVKLKSKSAQNGKSQLLSVNDWVAINEEGMEWYVGKIKSVEEVSEKKIYNLDSIMIRPLNAKSKFFKHAQNQNDVKKVFEDDIVCNILTPKELKKPKNHFSIKEFKTVEEKLNVHR